MGLVSKDQDKKELATAAMLNIGHLCHLSKWYVSFDYFLSRRSDIVFIGFQETLNEDFEKLKQLLYLPKDISLPSDDYRAHRNPTNLDRRLSDEAKEVLRDWYREDIKFIKLCKEIMHK